MTAKTDGLYKALFKARNEMGVVGKSGRNDHHKYDYAALNDYFAVIEGPLADNNLIVTTQVTDLIDLGSGRMAVKLLTKITHVTSGESEEFICFGEGKDAQDKATYKAITGGRKYAIACAFNLLTGDEPEVEEKKKKRKSAENSNRMSTPPPPPPPPPGSTDFTGANAIISLLSLCKTQKGVSEVGKDYASSIERLSPEDKKRVIDRAGELKKKLPSGE